jgi:hypothetical protein
MGPSASAAPRPNAVRSARYWGTISSRAGQSRASQEGLGTKQTCSSRRRCAFLCSYPPPSFTCLLVNSSPRYERTMCAVLARDQKLMGVQPVTSRHPSTLRRCGRGGPIFHPPQSPWHTLLSSSPPLHPINARHAMSSSGTCYTLLCKKPISRLAALHR